MPKEKIQALIKEKYPNIKIESFFEGNNLITFNLNSSEELTDKEFKNFEIKGERYIAFSELKKKESNKYSLSFFSFPSEHDYLKHLENINKNANNDHRGIGKELKIFDFDPLIGAGMPIWLERGTILKKEITNYVNQIQRKHGILLVTTPELGRKELYECSGHWDHYKENMFPPISLDENDEYVLRPMTCPHHIILYKKQKWSEKQLPVAYGENAKLYRYESSGGLFGLERNRCMELIDTHIFCSQNQINLCLEKIWGIIEDIKKAFEIEYDSIILSLRDIKDKEKFFDDNELWKTAEGELRKFLESKKVKYQEGIGDAAFYGPKIDFQIKTYIGKIITISTIQLDFLLPRRFKLEYLNQEQKEETPIMIHLGIIGTLERFVAYLLERDNGWLPFWLSPTQITLLPLNKEKHLQGTQKLANYYRLKNIRVEIDSSELSLAKRIAKAVDKKSYGFMVIGDKELEKINLATEEELLSIAEKHWKEQMINISKTRNKELNNKLSEERYPIEHMDFLRWASE